ncbi:MAG: DUF86 domain-containing protein [Mycolicibacterium sp.]|uniref:HepT-like ribonuclease domain-containing protein n=1 Tax=Mycolicibacterium sp. TaxID=2320850 RepID=UPI003D0CE048
MTNHRRGRECTSRDDHADRPEIPWRQIAAMRNFLIHEYFNIDVVVVEDVIANDLEPLGAAVNGLLANADPD